MVQKIVHWVLSGRKSQGKLTVNQKLYAHQTMLKTWLEEDDWESSKYWYLKTIQLLRNIKEHNNIPKG